MVSESGSDVGLSLVPTTLLACGIKKRGVDHRKDPMPTPCVTCKPGDATFHASAVESTGCETSYQAVDGILRWQPAPALAV